MTFKSTAQPLDNVTETGTYYATDLTNSPENYFGLVVVFYINDFVIQFWGANDVDRFYIRKKKRSNAWGPWLNIKTS